MIVIYFVIKKNLEISFRNLPEHKTSSLRGDIHIFCIKQNFTSYVFSSLFRNLSTGCNHF